MTHVPPFFKTDILLTLPKSIIPTSFVTIQIAATPCNRDSFTFSPVHFGLIAPQLNFVIKLHITFSKTLNHTPQLNYPEATPTHVSKNTQKPPTLAHPKKKKKNDLDNSKPLSPELTHESPRNPISAKSTNPKQTQHLVTPNSHSQNKMKFLPAFTPLHRHAAPETKLPKCSTESWSLP